jgi:hypothetical protein
MPDKITEARAAVEGCPSSIFTKQDVLAILSRIESPAAPLHVKVAPDFVKLRELKQTIVRFEVEIDQMSTYNTDVSLVLDGHEIIVESVALHGQDDVIKAMNAVTRLIDEMLADFTSA